MVETDVLIAAYGLIHSDWSDSVICNALQKHHRRTMMMWKNAVTDTWDNRPIEEVQQLIDRQPKVMEAITEAEGGRTPY